MKPLLLILAFLLSTLSFAQQPKAQLVSGFDSVTYFSDGTISKTFMLKKGKLHGYSIEFTENGAPLLIGKYKDGKKDGPWYYNDGAVARFKDGKLDGMATNAATTEGKSPQEKFNKLYQDLLKKSKKKKRK